MKVGRKMVIMDFLVSVHKIQEFIAIYYGHWKQFMTGDMSIMYSCFDSTIDEHSKNKGCSRMGFVDFEH